MKMVKKILLGTLAVAAILSIASCKREVAGNSDMIQVNAASSKASIDYTNETDDISRGWKTLETKHTDAICKISQTLTGDSTNGVMGYIFDLKNEDDGTVSFSLAGVRFVPSSGKPELQGYVETYKNVDKSTLEGGASFKKTDGSSALYSSADWDGSLPNVTSTTGGVWGKKLRTSAQLKADAYNSDTKTASVWVELVANLGNSTATRGGEAGSYTVNFYDFDPERKVSGNNITYKDGATPIATATIAKDDVNTAFTTALPETEQGFYATVYAKQNLKGEWKFDAIKKEAEEIEE